MGKKLEKKAKPKRKTFVLDTNVILHDGSCLDKFQEHDVVVPIAVIEELDGFKKGKETIHDNARRFIRDLDSIAGDQIFNGGISIGKGLGRVTVILDKEFKGKIKTNFPAEKTDHHILNCAFQLAEKKGFDAVVLVSKDTNLRMKAKAIGLRADDYKSDQVKSSHIYPGYRILENISSEYIGKIFSPPYEAPLPPVIMTEKLVANEYLVLRNGKQSALAFYEAERDQLNLVEKKTCSGIIPRNAEQTFALNALNNDRIPLVTLTGKAGTGKTILALAAALENKRFYRQIFLARPTVPLSNKDIGFLPGDIKSKLDPYMQPLYDNLAVIENGNTEKKKSVKEMLENEKIIVTPLSYIRGRSIVRTFFIIDEAQNLTPHEVKTIITRAGEGTKVVFTGDIFQIDHPYLDFRSNGLSYLIERMKGQNLHAHVNLEKGERSELSELAIKLL